MYSRYDELILRIAELNLFRDSLELVKSALDAKANPNVQIQQLDTKTPLANAAFYGRVEILRALLAAKADPNMLDDANTGMTPLSWAVCSSPRFDTVNVVRALLDAKANPNLPNPSTKETPLHWAAFRKDSETVRALLEAKADPDTPDPISRRTPLMLAISNGLIDMVYALLVKNAVVTHPTELLLFLMNCDQRDVAVFCSLSVLYEQHNKLRDSHSEPKRYELNKEDFEVLNNYWKKHSKVAKLFSLTEDSFPVECLPPAIKRIIFSYDAPLERGFFGSNNKLSVKDLDNLLPKETGCCVLM